LRLPVIGTTINKVLLEVQLELFILRNDILFFEWAGSLLIKVSNRKFWREKPGIITRLHSIEVATAADKINWSMVDVTIVVSEHIKRTLLAVANQVPKNIHVINSGVDLNQFTTFGARAFGYRIGMVCRVSPLKRVYDAILTIWDLRKSGYPFSLHIAGSIHDPSNPRYILAIRNLISRLGLDDHVNLHGLVGNIDEWLRTIDIFLSNSYWEGQQVAMLEAMASGCYVLSHWWAGAEEVLPIENIFFTELELQEKLVHYASLPIETQIEERAKLRKIAETRFDEIRMIDQITALVITRSRNV